MELTYEEAMSKVATLENKLNKFIAEKEDKKDDGKEERDAKYKKAMEDMENKDKERDASYQAEKDEDDKVKDAFRKAEEEKDDDKKEAAMKKAMDMKDKNDKKHEAKKGKRGEIEPKDEKKDPKEQDEKIASLERKYKEPIMMKILEATRIMDPQNYDSRRKELTAASLSQVEKEWEKLHPFVAGYIPQETTQSTGMIPFQASAALDNPENIFSASVDEIDFSKVSTDKIAEMYQ